MFTIHCPVLGHEVVIWSDQVTGLDRTAHGVAAEFHCACGSAAVCLAGECPPRAGSSTTRLLSSPSPPPSDRKDLPP